MAEVLAFEGRFSERSTSGFLLEQLSVGAGVSVTDGTLVIAGFPTDFVSFSCEITGGSIFPGQIGAVRVEIEQFKTALVDPTFGTNSVEVRNAAFFEDTHRLTSSEGGWDAFSFSSTAGWSSGLEALPSGADIEIRKTADQITWRNGVSAPFLDFSPAPIGLPSGQLQVTVKTAVVDATSDFTPMFDGIVRIYVEEYEAPVDPSAFWTDFAGTVETP